MQNQDFLENEDDNLYSDSGFGFSDQVLEDLEDYCDGVQEQKLKKSKPISLWLKFFEEWFNISVDLRGVFVFDKRLPGDSVLLVPKEMSVTQCLILLKEKLGIDIGDEIISSAENVVRRKKETYITYIQYKSYHGYLSSIRCKPLELVLINLFEFYSTGKKANTLSRDLNHIISKNKSNESGKENCS